MKFLIVDDHPIVREGIAKLLERENDFTVSGEAEDVNGAIAAMNKVVPDMLIVDITLSSSNGIDLIKYVRKDHARLPILVLSMHDSFFYAEQALRAGANGFITKAEAPKVLIQAIRKVLAGDIYVNELTAAALLKRSVAKKREKSDQDILLLSTREREIFLLLGKGMGTRQIAEKLCVSIRTIDTHRENIKHKLNLKNASELLQCAIEWTKNIR